MFKTSLLLLSLLAGNAAAAPANETAHEEALDLELEIEGRRELFPLLPGTKCPSGHRCRASPRAHWPARHQANGVAPLMSSLRDNIKAPLTAPETQALNNDLTTVVESNDYCTRRSAMARAAGLAAGLSVNIVNAPAFAASTTTIGMGSDSGQLVFVPAKASICKGDTVKWVIVKGGPHNVVFDEDDIPSGVDADSISMDGQIGDEGESYSKQFDVAGKYGYYCEPHRSAGMVASLTVA